MLEALAKRRSLQNLRRISARSSRRQDVGAELTMGRLLVEARDADRSCARARKDGDDCKPDCPVTVRASDRHRISNASSATSTKPFAVGYPTLRWVSFCTGSYTIEESNSA